MSKFIFVTGGVASSVGKGITVASLGRLLKNRGISVSLMKLDPYINVDPGTMSPYQHGEVFVTDDGAETDLDLGHYERFTDEPANQANNVTTGQVYAAVIGKELRNRQVERHRNLRQRVERRHRMPVLDPRQVAPQQPSFLFDITLR